MDPPRKGDRLQQRVGSDQPLQLTAKLGMQWRTGLELTVVFELARVPTRRVGPIDPDRLRAEQPFPKARQRRCLDQRLQLKPHRHVAARSLQSDHSE